MAAVASALSRRQCRWRCPVVAAALPFSESADHRRHVRVAEILKRFGGEGRARPARAVSNDLTVAIVRYLVDLGLEKAARNVLGSGDNSLFPLLALANIDHDNRLS